MKTNLSLDNVINYYNSCKQNHKDLITNSKYINFNCDISFDNQTYSLTSKSLSQLSNILNIPSRYVESLYNGDFDDKSTLKNNFYNSLRKLNKKLLFRLNTKSNTVRAILSNRYGIINNDWLVNTINDTFGNYKISVQRRISEDKLNTYLVFDDLEVENYKVMAHIGNSEIGDSRLFINPGLYRLICSNGLVTKIKDGLSINKIHLGKINYPLIKDWIVGSIKQVIDEYPVHLDVLKKSKNQRFTIDIRNILAELANNSFLNKESVNKIYTSYKIEESISNDSSGTLFGLVNAITRYSQLSPDWEKYDLLASKLLNYSTNKWLNLVNRASTIDSSIVNNYYVSA